MSKKLKDLKWESVALEGFPASVSDKFQGFVGLEECLNYGLDKEQKRSKMPKEKRKRKNEDLVNEIPNKKAKINQKKISINPGPVKPVKPVKLSNGFVVESCNTNTPSLTNETRKVTDQKAKKKKNRKRKNKKNKTDDKVKSDGAVDNEPIKSKNDSKKKPKLGESASEAVSNLTPEDMLTWAEFKLQEPIMRALMELGFKKPTKIQELSLPAAIHGRRDILGAAETGSGKTLAFGLPILSGILKLKEKAALGHDVYDLPYKKTSAKKKVTLPEIDKKSKKCRGARKDDKKKVQKAKESSEDGYGTDDEDNSDSDTAVSNIKQTHGQSKINENKDSVVQKTINAAKKMKDSKVSDDEEFIEEIEVPLRKRPSLDEGNDSDDSENFIHLSEMFDSDDLADSSDEGEKSKSIDDDDEEPDDNDDDESTESGNEEAEQTLSEDDYGSIKDKDDTVLSEDDDDSVNDKDDTVLSEDDDGDENNKDDTMLSEDGGEDDEIDENELGIGCVKVIDNIEMPGHVAVRTGKPLYALIVTPTRELAIQISRHLIAIAKYTGIKVATIVGGMAAVKQERVLRSGPEVVVATPGRLWELIGQGQPHLQQLATVKFLAIDETDRMIERGHFEELHPLLERLNADDGRKGARQNFVFSATLTMVHDLPTHMKGKKVTKRGKILNRRIEKMTPQQKIKRLVAMVGMTDPKVVDITTQNLGTAETLTESRITCALEHKDAHLYYVMKRHPGRTIVFCNSIGSVKRLAQLFTLLKCRPLPLHASMPQRQRLKNLERFRDDPYGMLVATDVAARGLDIPNVDHVIHYQVPRTAENYVHRSGRTARATKEGLTILMMEPSEAYLYAKLCRTLNKTTELPSFPVSSQCLSSLKELVSSARSLDTLMLKRRRAAQANGWRDKAAREMDIIIDDDDIPVKQIDPSIDKELQAKKRQLDSMLTRPMFPKGFSFKYPTLNDPTAFSYKEENALQAMKNSMASGEMKKEKRKSKNAPLLKLQKS